MENKKMDCISLLRMLSVFSIISCHIMQFYNNELAWWFNTGVQVFLLISGFLYSQKNIKVKEFYKKNIVKILFDYYVYFFIVLFFYILLKRDYLSILNIITTFFGMGGIDGLGHTWFISTIIICYMLTPFLQKIKNKVKNIFLLLVYFFILMGFVEVIFYFLSYSSGTWINCYIVGYIFGIFYSNKKYEDIFNFLSKITLIIGIFSNISQIYLKYFFTINKDNIIFKIFYRYNKILLALVILIIFVNYLKNYNSKNKYIQYIYMNKYSYDIYLTHHIYILGPFSILNFFLFKGKILGILVVFILSIMSGVILNKLCAKMKVLLNLV